MTVLLQAARYAGAGARVRALFARFIPSDEWTAILEAPDISTVLSWLRQSWYVEQLREAGNDTLDILQIERSLRSHWVWAARLPFYFLQGAGRQLLEWYWRRQELNNLKTVVRAIHHHTPPEQFLPALIPLGVTNELNWHLLLESNSIPELVERIRATWYGEVLTQALDSYRRQQSVFVLEVALDLAYHRRLRDLMSALRGEDRKDAEQFVGLWLDTQNLLWAYRYRIYMQLSPEEILNYTLHRNLRVSGSVIREIASGAPLLETVHQLWNGQVPNLETLRGLPEREAVPRLELLLWRMLVHRATKRRQSSGLTLGLVLAYEVLLESEVRDLISVLEGKMFGWTSAQIRPYLTSSRSD